MFLSRLEILNPNYHRLQVAVGVLELGAFAKFFLILLTLLNWLEKPLKHESKAVQPVVNRSQSKPLEHRKSESKHPDLLLAFPVKLDDTLMRVQQLCRESVGVSDNVD